MANVFQGESLVPGIQTERLTVEAQLYFGRIEQQRFQGGIIDSTALDSGHTDQTSQLRPGLILGLIRSTNKLVQWSPYAIDGSQYIAGFLNHHLDLELHGTAQDRYSNMLFYGGNAKMSEVLVPGASVAGVSGNAYEWIIREQLKHRFVFDDDIYGEYTSDHKIKELGTDTAETLVAADHNLTVTNVGGTATATVTLPAPLPGLKFRFVQKAGEILTVDSTATGQFMDGTATAANDATIAATSFSMLEVEGVRSATAPTYQYLVKRLV